MKKYSYKNIILFLEKNSNFSFFLFSLLICIYVNFEYEVWYINGHMDIDPWFYFGTAEFFDYLKNYFYDTYYFRRWTINLYNLFFQSNFGPIFGNFISKNLILFFSIFFFSKVIYISSNKNIFLPLIIFFIIFYFFYPYILPNFGTSYVESLSTLLFSIFLYFLLINNNSIKRLIILSFLCSLLFITYQINIRIILSGLLVFLFDKFNKINLNKKFFINCLILFLFTILFVSLFDTIISFFLKLDWKNLIIFSLSVDTNPDVFNAGYKTFYRDIPNRMFKVTYISGLLTSIFIILFFKQINNPNLKKLSFVYLSLTMFMWLEPYHIMGFSIYRHVHWSHIIFSIIINFIFFNLLISQINFKSIKDKRELFLFFIKCSLIFSSIFINYKICNRLPYNPNEYNSDFIKVILPQKINENRIMTNYAHTNKKRLSIIDYTPHAGWSLNSVMLYGLYSSLTVGYPPKLSSCNHLKWQLSYKEKLLISIISNKKIIDDLSLLRKFVDDCKFNEDFEYIKSLDKNIKLFKIVNNKK